MRHCQKILTVPLQWLSSENQYLDDVAKLGKFVCKIILQKYTSFWIDATNILSFAAFLWMAQILTDFQTGSKEKSQKWQKTHAICLLPVGKYINN